MSPEKAGFVTTGPVRAIGKRKFSMRGGVAVGGEPKEFESKLERDFLRLLDFDPDVAAIVAQPVRIEFKHPATGRKTGYIPDAYVRFAGRNPRQVLFQVKPWAVLREKLPELKPAWLAAMRFAREHGMTHRIVTEARIHGAYLENAVFLLRFRDEERDLELEDRIAATLATLGAATPDTLLKALFWDQTNRAMAIPCMWGMVARRRIVADLTKPLTMSSPLTIVPGEGYTWTDPYSRR